MSNFKFSQKFNHLARLIDFVFWMEISFDSLHGLASVNQKKFARLHLHLNPPNLSHPNLHRNFYLNCYLVAAAF